MAASPVAEAAVKKLARLPGNTVCPNCGATKKFGFGTVCIKYLTFVCNNCKSSHQAVSHRCKSLTMSSWTEGEVLQIKSAGGNDRARSTWLATAPPPGQGGRPLGEGDSINTYKKFIVDVYEGKRYFRGNDGGGGAPSPPQQEQRQADPASALATPREYAQRQPLPVGAAVPRVRAKVTPATPPEPPVVADLLDFGAFDTAPPTSSSNNEAFGAFSSTPATTNHGFGNFLTTTTITTTTSSFSAPYNNNNIDAFGDFSAPTPATLPAAAPLLFNPFDTSAALATSAVTDVFATAGATVPVAATTKNSNHSNFDPFGQVGGTTATTTTNYSMPSNGMLHQHKTPVMNNHNNFSNNSNNNLIGDGGGGGGGGTMGMKEMGGSVMTGGMMNGMVHGTGGMMNGIVGLNTMMNGTSTATTTQGGFGKVTMQPALGMMSGGGTTQSNHNNNGMMSANSMMMNNYNNGGSYGMMTTQQQPTTTMMMNGGSVHPMNINLMQSVNNNSISSNFSGVSQQAMPTKHDPFANLGF